LASSALTLYIDGAVAETRSGVSKGFTAAPFLLGLEDHAWSAFSGKLDEVRLFGVALSSSEIQTLAQ